MDDYQGSNSWMEVVAKVTGKIAERTRTSLKSPNFFSFTLYAFSKIIKTPRLLLTILIYSRTQQLNHLLAHLKCFYTRSFTIVLKGDKGCRSELSASL